MLVPLGERGRIQPCHYDHSHGHVRPGSNVGVVEVGCGWPGEEWLILMYAVYVMPGLFREGWQQHIERNAY